MAPPCAGHFLNVAIAIRFTNWKRDWPLFLILRKAREKAMPKRSILYLSLISLLTAGLLAGCHVAGHAPPGQVKKVVNPPPGHGGVPPGQLKKY
jgi:hypothetical protein